MDKNLRIRVKNAFKTTSAINLKTVHDAWTLNDGTTLRAVVTVHVKHPVIIDDLAQVVKMGKHTATVDIHHNYTYNNNFGGFDIYPSITILDIK